MGYRQIVKTVLCCDECGADIADVTGAESDEFAGEEDEVPGLYRCQECKKALCRECARIFQYTARDYVQGATRLETWHYCPKHFDEKLEALRELFKVRIFEGTNSVSFESFVYSRAPLPK